MELAINSLVLFIFFVFPVIVFRKFYFRGVFAKKTIPKDWLTTFYMSLFPGMLIQLISYYTFTHSIYKKPVPSFYTFIDCVYYDLKLEILPSVLFDEMLYFWGAIYLIVTIIIAAIIAQLCWKIVRYFELDIRYHLFRFDNYHHYYFSGECLKFKTYSGLLTNHDVLFTEVDVLVDIGNQESRLYKGIYAEHHLIQETRELKTLFLTDVRRYSDTRPRVIKPVPGHIMVIPGEKIQNLNLKYVTIAHANYRQKILFLFSLIILLIDIYNKFGLPQNDSIWIEILERFFLYFGWLSIAMFIYTFINPPSTGTFKLRFGIALTFILNLILLLLYFYYNYFK